MDPKKEKIQLPDDLISLTDLMDQLVEQYQARRLTKDERSRLKENYNLAAVKYNQQCGRRLYLENIDSVISSMKYQSKKTDTLK